MAKLNLHVQMQYASELAQPTMRAHLGEAIPFNSWFLELPEITCWKQNAEHVGFRAIRN